MSLPTNDGHNVKRVNYAIGAINGKAKNADQINLQAVFPVT